MKRAAGSATLHMGFFVVMVMLVAALSGCGVHKPLELMDANYQVKPGPLAVISGDNSEADVKLAEYLTQELKQRSTFRTMSQEEINRHLTRYPLVIKTSRPKDVDKPVWYTQADKAKLDAIQAQLKTDYLLVVWVAGLSRQTVTYSRGGGKTTYFASVIGNLVEYPRAKAIAYTNFAESKDQSCCLFGKSEGQDIDDLLKASAESIADKFLAATGSEKTKR